MKILIAGARGQLGCELTHQAQSRGFEVMAAGRRQMNIAAVDQVEDTIAGFQPQLVINAAAYNRVDEAESNPELALAVNQTGAANLAVCCATHHIALIHISTDYVFDGSKNVPYNENDPVNPLGRYGQSKAAGEAAVRAGLEKHIIIRTSWLYSAYGHNFVKTILRLAGQRDVLQVVDDQYGSPTSAADLAEAILSIAQRQKEGAAVRWGTYHYCGEGVTTWYGFAAKIIELAQPYGRIRTTRLVPVKTSDYPTAARRPHFSALDCRRIKTSFGIRLKPWQQSLQAAIGKIL